MADGNLSGDEPILGPPPAPDDRLWRHPSEVAWAAAHPPSQPDSARSRPWLLAGLGAIGGALIIGTVWASTGDHSRTRVVSQGMGDFATTPNSTDSANDDPVGRAAQQASATVHTPNGSDALAGAVAVDDDGHLLTSARATDGYSSFLVRTSSGAIVTAVLVGTDITTDLSVLRMETSLPAAPTASDLPRRGDPVAVVDPEGHSQGRKITRASASSTAVDGDHLIGLLSLDGPLGDAIPGSAIVDARGNVVGITAATAAGAPMAGIPIGVATTIAHDLIATGTVNRARLGITARDLDDSHDRGQGPGCVVSAVDKNGPADHGGIKQSDVIVAIEHHEVESTASLVATLRYFDPGETVTVVVNRDGKEVSRQVELGRSDSGP